MQKWWKNSLQIFETFLKTHCTFWEYINKKTVIFDASFTSMFLSIFFFFFRSWYGDKMQKKKKNSQWISLFTNKTKFSSWIIFFVIQTKHFSFSNPFLRRRTNINFVRHGEKKRCIFIKDTLTLKKLKGMIAKKNSKNNYMQIKWNIKNYKDQYTHRGKKNLYTNYF